MLADVFNVVALVLAGGEGSRMGGVDKGLQHYQGIPLVEHAVQLVSPLADDVLVSANRNIDVYQALTERVLRDDESLKGIGPLAGILTAVEAIDASHLLIVPCDTPRLSRAALSKLIEQAYAKPDLIHFLATQSGAQPLHAILPVPSVKRSLRAFLDTSNHYGVMKFYRDVGFEEVLWALEDELDNINYIQQLKTD